MSEYIDCEALQKELSDAVAWPTLAIMDAISRVPGINFVKCGECKYRSECIGAVVFSSHRSGNTYFRTIDYCSLGEKE